MLLEVSLAVGTVLGFTALVITMIEVSEQTRIAEGGDIKLSPSGPGRRLDRRAAAIVAEIEGVDEVQPIIGADILVGDTDTFAWGLPPEPVFPYLLSDGRWFSEEENEQRAAVAVVGPALVTLHDLRIGDTLRAETLGARSGSR